MNKNILVVICFFCIFSSCVTNRSIEEDTWKNITSLEEIMGDWFGILTLRDNRRPYLPEFEIPITTSITKDYNQSYVTTTIADFSQMLNILINIIANSYGLDASVIKDLIWETVIEETEELENREIIWGKYYQKVIRIYPFRDRDRNFLYENYFIDNTGDRMRWHRDGYVAGFIIMERI